MELKFLSKMNNKGLSQIVGAMLLVAITLIAGGIVLTSTNTFVRDKLDKSQSCFDLFGQITINDEYTCYDNVEERVQLSLSVKDNATLESILVAVRFEENSFNFRLNGSVQDINLVTNYPSNSTGVKMPNKEGGDTYFINDAIERPLMIEIAPKTKKTQCDIVDSLGTIGFC